MAESHGNPGIDLSAGVPIGGLADGAMVHGHVGDDRSCLRDRAMSGSPSARAARTTKAASIAA
jgi:hypothetical protein